LKRVIAESPFGHNTFKPMLKRSVGNGLNDMEDLIGKKSGKKAP